MSNSSLLQEMVSGRAPSLERLNVEQFHRMLATGILKEGAPVELIEGLIVRKNRSDAGCDRMIHGPRHASGVKRFQRLNRRLDALPCHLQCQLPITLADDLEPEPDGAIIRGKEEEYQLRHPGPADVLLIAEIADSSLEFDRTTKQQLYAAADIPAYWIVNLREGCIEAMEEPSAAQRLYARRRVLHAGDALAIDVGGDALLEIAVAELLP